MDRLDGAEIASLCIKPYAVQRAVKRLPKTAVGTVIGFPHGSPTTASKAYETKEALDAGAVDIDMVVNIGWVKGQAWTEVGSEIEQLLKIVREQEGILKVIFENDLLVDDALKTELCHLCSMLEVDFVKTSTGFGFTKQPDGQIAALGATEHDVQLMRRESNPQVGVKASGGIRSLDDLMKMVFGRSKSDRGRQPPSRFERKPSHDSDAKR